METNQVAEPTEPQAPEDPNVWPEPEFGSPTITVLPPSPAPREPGNGDDPSKDEDPPKSRKDLLLKLAEARNHLDDHLTHAAHSEEWSQYRENGCSACQELRQKVSALTSRLYPNGVLTEEDFPDPANPCGFAMEL